jgi:hypothetical protein
MIFQIEFLIDEILKKLMNIEKITNLIDYEYIEGSFFFNE